MRLNQYQDAIKVSDVPVEELPDLLEELFSHLKLTVIREETPDYTAFRVVTTEDFLK